MSIEVCFLYSAILPDFAEVYSFIYCFLLLLQVLVQLKLPFNLRIKIWYYRAPEIIFGATKYTTSIDICSRYVQAV
ncbi:hypothetical protein ES288_A06G150300v1 [Gossypium darwinii]|uniref:Uncharacterized protein n=1 Tax=Gossypium darwinii TaxID=34276 RepID=A0A5D2G8Z8_GOSDA|nr:hypothetical protein ES288_A06G150300v1 [Gossypium darwinii]